MGEWVPVCIFGVRACDNRLDADPPALDADPPALALTRTYIQMGLTSFRPSRAWRDMICMQEGRTALHCAVSPEIAALLIENGADVDKRDIVSLLWGLRWRVSERTLDLWEGVRV